MRNINQFEQIMHDEDRPEIYGLPNGIDKAINRFNGK